MNSISKRLTKSGLPKSAVEDLLQDTFLRAISPKARLTYDSNRNYLPYLKTIARNCLIDSLRLEGREVLVNSIEELGTECPSSLAHSDPTLLRILRVQMNALPVELSAILIQRFLLERSQSQASSALGITRAALRTREKQLCRHLRANLQAEGVVIGDLLSTRRVNGVPNQ